MSRPEVVSCLVQRDSTALSENKGLIILSLEKSLNMSVLVVLIFRLTQTAKILETQMRIGFGESPNGPTFQLFSGELEKESAR